MKCWKCDKEMTPPEGCTSIIGIEVNTEMAQPMSEAQIKYNKKQLGKYSNDSGECHIMTCYECYIDGLFNKVWK